MRVILLLSLASRRGLIDARESLWLLTSLNFLRSDRTLHFASHALVEHIINPSLMLFLNSCPDSAHFRVYFRV